MLVSQVSCQVARVDCFALEGFINPLAVVICWGFFSLQIFISNVKEIQREISLNLCSNYSSQCVLSSFESTEHCGWVLLVEHDVKLVLFYINISSLVL